jgi:hypothetical protein
VRRSESTSKEFQLVEFLGFAVYWIFQQFGNPEKKKQPFIYLFRFGVCQI